MTLSTGGLLGGKRGSGSGADFGSATLSPEETALLVKTNKVIQKVSADAGEGFRFNTALSAIMELRNDIGVVRVGAAGGLAAAATGKAVLAYAPEMMGRKEIWDAPWPQADARFLTTDTVELAVQINGKVRDRVDVAKDAADVDVLAAAKALPGVAKYLEGATLVEEVVVPGRQVTLVVK